MREWPDDRFGLHINHEQEETVVTLNTSVMPGDGTVPEWVELIPAGEKVVGIDGREFLNDQPQGILDYFAKNKAYNRELPIDFNHSSELLAPKGEPAPAAGWCSELEIRPGGAIWGKVAWTPKGQGAVASRESRYLSPALVYEKKSGRIVGITSVGLVNKPNLKLQALNHEDETNNTEEEMLKKMLLKLALAENATEAEALNAIGKLQSDLATAINSQNQPSLAYFVPRADHEAVVARANNAENALAALKKTEQETAINAEIDAALAAGKITPATKDYHIANCRQEGGLALFRDYVKTAPVVGDPSGLENKKPAGEETALNAEELKICAQLGVSEEDYKKAV